ncbi:hypothetical protein [Sporichthya sp.]|uniref:hypothetical protein n=1 Tax=Sporichthya sp. TaxID=65475 RepID=UPI0017ED4A7E|nr:hypothetical protein [Sporichthya sp.]MBA3742089.1 hypothetical protein [Sporichthya sp.]
MTLFARRRRSGAAPGSDSGYAMLSVIGFGTAMVLTVGAVGAYALQGLDSAGRAQGFHAAVQAAQAGVDDFVSRLNAAGAAANPLTTALGTTTADTDWVPVPGSVDGADAPCVGTDATLPPNCPRFRYAATSAGDIVTVTARGKARDRERAVQVTLKKRALTDYLYFSDIEAADPADGFAYSPLFYSAAARAACGKPAWGPDPRPASGCQVPAWRGDDSTEGSRVHTDDVFATLGTPTFDSRVTASIAACATDATACVRTAAGGPPVYNAGLPAYADDLDMPANGLAQIAANATTAAGGCTYYGPTRIRFEGTNKMRVWSPQTPNTPACGGGIPDELLNTSVSVQVTSLNQSVVCLLLSLNLFQCAALLLAGVAQVSLSAVINNNLLSATGLRQVVNGLVADGDLVDVPSGAIYVQENAVGNSPIPDPTFIQCLLGSALGMYSTVDTNVTAGLLNSANQPQANCRAGKLFVDGVLDGKVTAGVAGDIIIMSNLIYRTSDNADDDRLGLVATGPVEVYNPLQCALAVGTCLSLETIPDLQLAAIASIRVGTGNLGTVLNAMAGYGDDVTVEASIISLEHRFGMQLPVLSLSLDASLLNQLVALNIDPPTLTVHGSIAQRYRGIVGADLVQLSAGVLGVNLASANTDMGYAAEYTYDGKLRSDAPPYLPAPAAAIWDPQTFAEIAVP